MAFKWSKNQLEAIRTIGSNVLVSAGAGSGKTAVLTERIFQIIKSGHSLSRFLVLTFTNAAAGEMKTRLRDNFSLIHKPIISPLRLKLLTSKLLMLSASILSKNTALDSAFRAI